MNRCDRLDLQAPPSSPHVPARRAALWRLAGTGAAALAAWGGLAAPARAGMRVFPMGTRRGQMDFVNPPLVQLNGQPEQLGPGTRVHEPLNNRLVFAHTLKGQSLTVNYVRDGSGTIRDIWILTPGEIQEKLPPMPPEVVRNPPPAQGYVRPMPLSN